MWSKYKQKKVVPGVTMYLINKRICVSGLDNSNLQYKDFVLETDDYRGLVGKAKT